MHPLGSFFYVTFDPTHCWRGPMGQSYDWLEV